MEKEIALEIVVEKLNLYELFGRNCGIPEEICVLIEKFRIELVEDYYLFFKGVVNFRCCLCVAYKPTRLMRTHAAIKSQANTRAPAKPRISHILLMDGSLFDLLDYLNVLMGRVNKRPLISYEPQSAEPMTAAQYFWESGSIGSLVRCGGYRARIQ